MQKQLSSRSQLAELSLTPHTAGEWEVLSRLTTDLQEAARRLGREHARLLVDSYYTIQKSRIRYSNNVKESLRRGVHASMLEAGLIDIDTPYLAAFTMAVKHLGFDIPRKLSIDFMVQVAGALGAQVEPYELLAWFSRGMQLLERRVSKALEEFAKDFRVGQWLTAQTAVGHTIAAGLLAEIDIRKTPTPGHLWSFCGLNPTRVWERGMKRPWNARLKTLAVYKLGQSFVKHSKKPDCYYGQLYLDRRAVEWTRNLSGQYAPQATIKVASVDKKTAAYKWLAGCYQSEDLVPKPNGTYGPPNRAGEPGSGVPMLSPLHIHCRARRWVVKVFLSALHYVMWQDYFGMQTVPPKPWILSQEGHSHELKPLLWPGDYSGKSLRYLDAQ